MPWKLVPPRQDKTPYYYVRGKYLGIALDKSTGTAELRAAKTILAMWKRMAERGEFKVQCEREPPKASFLSAAVAYMQAGGERKYIEPILNVWGEKPIEQIDQIAIDTLADQLYSTASPATKNRQVYTPVSAILKHLGIERKIKRPKGWRGNKSTSWLEPEQAFALFEAAHRIEPEFGLFCRFLCYTGMRLSEALGIELRQLHLDRSFVYLPDSKNGEPRGCHLPPVIVEAFRRQPPRLVRLISVKGRRFSKGDGGRSPEDPGVPFLLRSQEAKLFRFHRGSALNKKLKVAMQAAGLRFPRRQGGFHIFCHTYGSWMHRFGGLDTYGLTRTRRWADPSSADRYIHTGASEEAQRSNLLPTPKRGADVENEAYVG